MMASPHAGPHDDDDDDDDADDDDDDSDGTDRDGDSCNVLEAIDCFGGRRFEWCGLMEPQKGTKRETAPLE